MKKVIRRVLGILVVFLIIAGAVALRMHRKHQQETVADANIPPWALRVVPVEKRDIAKVFPVLSTVLTSEEITISGQLQGEILSMGPREGEKIKKGDVLAKIDTREIDQEILSQKAKLSGLEADLVSKKDQYERLKKVLDRGGASVADVDAAQAAYLAAKHSKESVQRLIEGLKIRRSYATVKSPSDGIIAARLAEPGNICSMSHPLYKITVLRGARVQVSLPQQIIMQLKVGADLELKCCGSKTQTVKISRIFPALDARALGLAEADIDVAPFGLRSGSRVAGRVILDERKNALVVPHASVLVNPDDPTKGVVFVVPSSQKSTASLESEPTQLKKIPVTIDLSTSSGVAVLGDLHPGDLVVKAHDAVLLQLHNNDSVVIIPTHPSSPESR